MPKISFPAIRTDYDGPLLHSTSHLQTHIRLGGKLCHLQTAPISFPLHTSCGSGLPLDLICAKRSPPFSHFDSFARPSIHTRIRSLSFFHHLLIFHQINAAVIVHHHVPHSRHPPITRLLLHRHGPAHHRANLPYRHVRHHGQ